MSLASTLTLLEGVAWSFTGARTIGHRLIDKVVAGDDDAREMAGIYLVRNPDRSVPLIAAELESGAYSEELVTVLASIASPEAERVLSRLATDGEPGMSTAATNALEELAEIKRRDTSGPQ